MKSTNTITHCQTDFFISVCKISMNSITQEFLLTCTHALQRPAPCKKDELTKKVALYCSRLIFCLNMLATYD